MEIITDSGVIVLSHIRVMGGNGAWSSPGEYLDNPPEPMDIEFEAAWKDGREFTEDDYWLYYGIMEDCILEERGQ